jgi:DNA-binding winged helix-turn-helix (wHTH) protein
MRKSVSADFRVGPWLVEPSLNSISRNGATTRLEPKMMQMLVCLAEYAGETLSKEKLLKTVWPDTFVSDAAWKRSISELRRVFEDDASEPRVIQTIAKRGYRFIAAVSREGDCTGYSGRHS